VRYFYGRRSNLYLFLLYGFTLEDNQHDSFLFNVNIAIDKIKDINFSDLISSGQLKNDNVLRQDAKAAGSLSATTSTSAIPFPIANRLMLERHHDTLDDVHSETIALKKERLCHRLLSYIKLVL